MYMHIVFNSEKTMIKINGSPFFSLNLKSEKVLHTGIIILKEHIS